MQWRREVKLLGLLIAVFLAIYYLPVGSARFDGAVIEALELVKWYAREHILLCLIPAFFIAGAISVFIRRDAVMKYLGAGAPKSCFPNITRARPSARTLPISRSRRPAGS